LTKARWSSRGRAGANGHRDAASATGRGSIKRRGHAAKAAISKASINRSKAQIELAKIEVKRSTALVAERAGSQRELDIRRTALQTTSAGLEEEEAS